MAIKSANKPYFKELNEEVYLWLHFGVALSIWYQFKKEV